MKKNKIVSLILIMILVVISVMTNKSFAAGGFSIGVSSSNVTVGDTVIITITGNNAYGTVNISASSGTLSATKVFLENNSQTVKLTTNTAGTVSINVSPAAEGLGDSDENPITGSQSTTITVNEAQTQPTEPDQTPDPTPEEKPESKPTPEPEKPVEPTFSNANKTMYATGDINLRASWSTDSAATRIEKGTELTVIGTSTEKVNGYVWYRVSYEGKTRYVASSLLTSEKPEEENEEEKANANLKSLTVEGFTLSPSFSADTLEYTMQVKMDTEKLDIKAETENEKATVKIEGNETLTEGENTVKVIVTAEDGTTTKTYVIKVTKQEEVFGLLSLIIKGTNIADIFKTDVYEYEIDVENIDILDIEAIATQEDATIEIIGNENLLEGENFITIIVKSKDETQTVTYQIKVNRLVVIDEPNETGTTIDTKYIIYGAIGLVLVIALVGVVIYFVKHRKEENFFDDVDDFNYYPEDLPEKEEYEYYAEDLPEKKVEEKSFFGEEDYEEDEIIKEDEDDEELLQESIKEDKSSYFLEDPDDWGEYKRKNKKGKHF